MLNIQPKWMNQNGQQKVINIPNEKTAKDKTKTATHFRKSPNEERETSKKQDQRYLTNDTKPTK